MTGAALAEYFGGLGYGWSSDIVRLVLAVLFRAGAIEVTHQARRHRNYQDPQARIPFSTNPAFRSASFSPTRIDRPQDAFEGCPGTRSHAGA